MECLSGEAHQGSHPSEREVCFVCETKRGFPGAEETRSSRDSVLWPKNRLRNRLSSLWWCTHASHTGTQNSGFHTSLHVALTSLCHTRQHADTKQKQIRISLYKPHLRKDWVQKDHSDLVHLGQPIWALNLTSKQEMGNNRSTTVKTENIMKKDNNAGQNWRHHIFSTFCYSLDWGLQMSSLYKEPTDIQNYLGATTSGPFRSSWSFCFSANKLTGDCHQANTFQKRPILCLSSQCGNRLWRQKSSRRP